MWPNPQSPADLVTITEEILNEKLHFLCSDNVKLEYCANNTGSLRLILKKGQTHFKIHVVFTP